MSEVKRSGYSSGQSELAIEESVCACKFSLNRQETQEKEMVDARKVSGFSCQGPKDHGKPHLLFAI